MGVGVGDGGIEDEETTVEDGTMLDETETEGVAVMTELIGVATRDGVVGVDEIMGATDDAGVPGTTDPTEDGGVGKIKLEICAEIEFPMVGIELEGICTIWDDIRGTTVAGVGEMDEVNIVVDSTFSNCSPNIHAEIIIILKRFTSCISVYSLFEINL